MGKGIFKKAMGKCIVEEELEDKLVFFCFLVKSFVISFGGIKIKRVWDGKQIRLYFGKKIKNWSPKLYKT